MDLTDDEKEFWKILKYGPPLFELYNVNTFIANEHKIEVYGYININYKREFKVEIFVDGIALPKDDFVYYPDALSIKDSYPRGCRISIHRPLRFECAIMMTM